MEKYVIVHQPEHRRFETEVEGATAFVEYLPFESGGLNIVHTIVPPRLQGRGIAAALTQAVVEYARERGVPVKASCSYAVAWLLRHPEYQ